MTFSPFLFLRARDRGEIAFPTRTRPVLGIGGYRNRMQLSVPAAAKFDGKETGPFELGEPWESHSCEITMGDADTVANTFPRGGSRVTSTRANFSSGFVAA